MNHSSSLGTAIAAMAAGLFMSAIPVPSQAADTDKVHCHGINACKGKSACNGKDHACAGQNSCKGKGWIETTEKECKAKGGKVERPAAAPAPKK